MEEDDFDPLFRYRRRVTDDPIRLHILAAHALIEEMLELVIAEAVPNSECFEVSKMQFWKSWISSVPSNAKFIRIGNQRFCGRSIKSLSPAPATSTSPSLECSTVRWET